MLLTAHNTWESANQALASYEQSENSQYLINARQAAENVVVYLGQWPTPTAKGGAAVRAAAVFSEYQTSASAGLQALRERIAALEQLISDHDEALRERVTTLDGQRLAVANDLTALDERIVTAETRLDTAINTQTSALAEAQATRDKEFRDEMKSLSKNSTTEAGKVIAQMKSLKDDADGNLAALMELRSKTEKLAADTTPSLLARDYGSYSTREFWSGIIAYGLGFAALVGLGFFLVDTLGSIRPNERVS